MKISIRFATPDDLDFIAEGDKSVKKNQLNWKIQNNEILLAQTEEEMIGYLRLEYLWSKYPYIGIIIVRSEYQRQGAGKKLLEYLENHLKRNGLNKLYSSSQVSESEPQAWHRHMGFMECGIINEINDGNVGEVFFVKNLN
jgi:N-acetylglutamate synthase-like GNAT family acetyltransferase